MMDLYQDITDRIIKALEIGVIPWHRPWCSVIGGAYGRVTGRPYSLLNQISLRHGAGAYATFEQWHKLGARIKQGEKAETIVFWKRLEATEEEAESDEEAVKATKPKFVLRHYKVFHQSQTIGGSDYPGKQEQEFDHDRIRAAETLAKGYIEREGITFEESKSNEAYYIPPKDLIHVPALSQYKDKAEFYSTVIHECVHSTGHSKRLNRPGLATVSYGSETYSKEELIAEIGAASILHSFGIETEDSFANSVSYIDGWLKQLRDDKYLIVNAASAAEKAAKFIFGAEAANAS